MLALLFFPSEILCWTSLAIWSRDLFFVTPNGHKASRVAVNLDVMFNNTYSLGTCISRLPTDLILCSFLRVML